MRMKLKNPVILSMILAISLFCFAACTNNNVGESNADRSESVTEEMAAESEVTEAEEDEVEAEEVILAEGYELVRGYWKVGGIYYNSRIVDVHDNSTIEQMYEAETLVIRADGTYIHYDFNIKEGTWSVYGENQYLLKTERAYRLDVEDGEVKEIEATGSSLDTFILYILPDGAFKYLEFDAITGKGKADYSPRIFVRYGEESSYIQENKMEISDSKDNSDKVAGNSASGEAGGTGGSDNRSSSSIDLSGATIPQLNAVDTAKLYLEVWAFSRQGLIEQLEYEGFSTQNAEYGADHCGADWYEQAVKSAENYLDVFDFSREELIEQLEFEGFTHEEAVHGADAHF